MAARIRSTRNFITPVDEASRDDLVLTDVVTVTSLDAATTYAWALVFVPEGSVATFSGDVTAVSPGSFTVDVEGPYLVRLIVDAGLAGESSQYVRLRALTSSLGLTLVAAGERRDESGTIPVDVDPEGWAYEQNANLLALEAAITAASPTQDLTSGEALAANDVVAFDTNAAGGRAIKSNAATASRAHVVGVAQSAAAGAGLAVPVTMVPGRLVAMTFDVAPVAGNQGSPVYLHTVNGQVSLTAPVASGTTVFRVGILQDAANRRVAFFPQFVGVNP